MWIFTLPWTVAYLVYETSWDALAPRVLLLVLIATAQLCAPKRALTPRAPHSQRDAAS